MRSGRADRDLPTAEETEDLESFQAVAPTARGESLRVALATPPPAERAFRASVARFAERHLPRRGWIRVLDLVPGVGASAVFLGERGYDLTLGNEAGTTGSFLMHRLARRGIPSASLPREAPSIDVPANRAARRYDAVLVAPRSVQAADDPKKDEGGLERAGPDAEALVGWLAWRGVLIVGAEIGPATELQRALDRRRLQLVRMPSLEEGSTRCYSRRARLSDLVRRG